jgi:hypothetical protein
MNTTIPKIHSFSRKLAREHGDTEALLLGYFGHRIARSQQKHDGRTWHYETLDELAKRYPYLGRTAIYNALAKLSSSTGPLISGNYNKMGFDRTKWYAFRDNQAQRHLQAEPVYFRVDDAEKYGVIGAVLLMNIAHWIHKNRETKPTYQYHAMSPDKLVTVLPYSESAIKRALKSLTSDWAGTLVARRPVDGRGASEYGFADEGQVSKYGDGSACTGSNLNEQNPNPNMAGSNVNMGGSNTDLAGPFVNMAGPNVNNNTILIDNHLKTLCLEDKELKTKDFQSACVSDSFSSSASSDQDKASTSTSGNPSNSFQEQVEGDSKVAVETKLADESDAVHSASSVPSSLASLAPLPTSISLPQPAIKPASLLFLDPEIDSKNKEFCNTLGSLYNKEDVRRAIAGLVVEVIGELARISAPKDLFFFVQLPNQRELDAALAKWATPFFQNIYEKDYSNPELPENEDYRAMFLNYCQRVLSMAFYGVKYLDNGRYVGQSFASRASLEIFKAVNPWLEEQAKLRQIEDIKRRTGEFKSPDQHLENVADLSASEKMQVFVQSLMARNKVGQYDDRGKFVQQVVRYDQTSKMLVREFFQSNPSFTVKHLNLILDECVKMPAQYYDGDADPQWHARNGRDIIRFIRSIDIIAGQMNVLDQLPAIVPLPVREVQEAVEA